MRKIIIMAMLILVAAYVTANPAEEILGDEADFDGRSYESGFGEGEDIPQQKTFMGWLIGALLALFIIAALIFIHLIRHP